MVGKHSLGEICVADPVESSSVLKISGVFIVFRTGCCLSKSPYSHISHPRWTRRDAEGCSPRCRVGATQRVAMRVPLVAKPLLCLCASVSLVNLQHAPACALHFTAGSARLGSARLGSARLGSARLGSARLGSARLGSARLGSARLGSARLGSARLGSARLGSARLGSARLGSARLG